MCRVEHPNPQFKRSSYVCLNGAWDFAKCKYGADTVFTEKIEVPFCPESELSGIGDRGFIPDCVYSRDVEVTEADLSGRLVLHFGAVDYIAKIYVNGVKCAEHIGGYTAFEVDIAPYAHVGTNNVTVAVHDDVRENIPSGKQSKQLDSHGCFYTRSTGIWQTVWLERTPKNYVKAVKFYPQPDYETVKAEVFTEGCGDVEINVYFAGKKVGEARGCVEYRHVFDIKLSELHLWSVGEGNLYDAEIVFGSDRVESYFGFRTAAYDGMKFMLNGKSVFQRLVLDQGYYEDGIYTAKDEKQFAADIALSKALGFNGARLHQKIFEQRFLYECDKAGYMVWCEFPNWGMKCDNVKALGLFVMQWSEVVEQYFNHPSIVTWCPLNEVWEDLENKKLVRDVRFVEAAYNVTKLLDPTRPCVDASGGYHGRYTDIFDFHNYHSGDETLGYIQDIETTNTLTMDTLYAPDFAQEKIPYSGELPLNASEYGGMIYKKCTDGGWGYRTETSEESFVDEYVQMTEAYLDCNKISGFCYMQLYDVEQEQNGLYSYSRERKFSDDAMKRIAACNARIAAIEKI